MPQKKSPTNDRIMLEQINTKLDLLIEMLAAMETRLMKGIDEQFDLGSLDRITCRRAGIKNKFQS